MAAPCIFLLVVRCLYATRLRAGSDETQHLHVVWAWASGLLPYRDVFDNHTPLFHLLYALPFHWLGERADILVPMRLAVLPLYFVALGCVAWLGARIFSLRAGVWAAWLAGCWPLFFYTELEFRTDVLWTCLWLLTLAVLLDRDFTPRRAWAGGLLLGAAFATSMKTSVLAAALLAAALVAWTLDFILHRAPSKPRRPLACLGLAVAGLCLVPALIVSYFAWRQALPQFWYGVIGHNIVPGLGRWRTAGRTRIAWSILPVCLAAGWLFLRVPASTGREIRLRRAILFLTVGFYSLGMYGYWPLLTKQDALPAIPLASLVASGLFFGGVELLAGQRRWISHAGALAALLALFFEAKEIRSEHSLRQRSLNATITMVQTVLRLTHPGEMVMDGKGETIFRPRPYYYALENITTDRMRFGLLVDDIPEHLIATRTAVVHDFRLPDAAQNFVRANYLPLQGQEQIYVLGKVLLLARDGQSADFELTIPGEYCFVSEGRVVEGSLDGEPFHGPGEIVAGKHRFAPGAPLRTVSLFLARAQALGYGPALGAAGQVESAQASRRDEGR